MVAGMPTVPRSCDRRPLLGLVGPTGAGKSDVARELAAAHGWEIVMVDSRQVYRRLDIGTAKPGAEDRRRVPYHMIDCVDPDCVYDAQRYAEDASQAIAGIEARDHRALLEGGSGLYLRALLAGGFDGPPGSAALRDEILEAARHGDPGWLHRELSQVDPASAARLHAHDTFRLVRALEIVRLSGRAASEVRPGLHSRRAPRDIRLVVLTRPKAELDRRIAGRWEAMIARGLVEEVRELLREGTSPEVPGLRSPGYREIVRYLHGELSWRDASETAVRRTCRYAKRQVTWFRHQEVAHRIEIGGESCAEICAKVGDLWLPRPRARPTW